METPETQVFGDVIFRSEPVAVEGRKRVANAGDMERARVWFVFRP